MAIRTNSESIVGGSDTKNPARRRARQPRRITALHVAFGANPSPPTTPATQPATTRNSHPPRILHPEPSTATSFELIADLFDEPWDYVPAHARHTEGHTLL
ncbi:MAG TPA: hypothetical protein VLZ30_04425 [Verrucomicrobiae bacterium]|nr:hypothetical protein [Verrucomicrobiae bacterium]